ncbi:hypothetical protein L7F22_020573 [Adiantum nelumboides]|nr:hypothetical protein [Adiantum nelumboides]
MSLSVGYCGSCYQVRILRRESYISELPRRSNRPCITLKAPIGGWRTWILEEPEAKFSASSVKFKHFCQPFRSSQLDRQSALAHAEVIECADGERSLCSTKGILLAIGRILFILGLGLSISLPASAWTAAPPISDVSVGDARKKATQSGEVVRERDGVVDSVYSQNDASRREGIEVTKHSMSNQTDTAETTEDKLLFSEAFWRGIPTPEGSFMHRLKLQLEDNPSDVSVLEALLQAVLEQQDMLRALTVIETLLEVQPNNVEWKFLKARTHEFLGELLMAKQEYEELLSLHPLSACFLQVPILLVTI